MLDNFEMPKRERARDQIQAPEEAGQGDMGEESMEEEIPEESPLAVFSDEEILAEAQARGLV